MPVPTPLSSQTKPYLRPSDAVRASTAKPASVRAAGLSVLFYGAWLGVVSGWLALGTFDARTAPERTGSVGFVLLQARARHTARTADGVRMAHSRHVLGAVARRNYSNIRINAFS